MNKTARNERRKASATFLNGVAIVFFGAGALGPLSTMAKEGATATLVFLVLVCVLLAGVLHLLARWLLGGIEE